MTVGGELRKVFQGVVEKVGQSSGVLLVTFSYFAPSRSIIKNDFNQFRIIFSCFFEGGGRGSVNNFMGPVSSLIAKSFKDFAFKKALYPNLKRKITQYFSIFC